MSRKPAFVHQLGEVPHAVPRPCGIRRVPSGRARARHPRTAPVGVCPPAWSQTHAATTPLVACHARHLRQSAHRIVHEVDDQLCQGSVELAIGERQLLGRGDAYVDPGMAARGLRQRMASDRINRRDCRCSETP